VIDLTDDDSDEENEEGDDEEPLHSDDAHLGKIVTSIVGIRYAFLCVLGCCFLSVSSLHPVCGQILQRIGDAP
jgi:hypothetical protein